MKKILFLALLLSVTASAFAVEAEINGLWYELVSKTKEAKVIQYKNNNYYSGNIVIPETVEYNGNDYNVTSIGDCAFWMCIDLTSVTISNSVTNIGSSAFHYCVSLTSVTIPNSVTRIGNDAFYYCMGLTSVTIPSSVTSIGGGSNYNDDNMGAFYGCDKLTSVHISDIVAWCKIVFTKALSNPLSYASHLYLGEEEITDLVIPYSVTSIGNYAFSGCGSLITVTIPNNVTSIGDGAFGGCIGLTSVTIPSSVTSIGEGTFSRCSGLTFVTIPNSVTSIGGSAFLGCSSLSSMTIPNSVTKIGNYAFSNCSGLTSVTIGNNVTSIGDCAFVSCSGLSSVTIPNCVTSIGRQAFQGCNGVTSINIGSGVNIISPLAFSKCPEMADVYCYAEKVPSASSAFEGSYIEYTTLHVPTTSIDAYKSKTPWSSFKTIVGLDGAMPDEPEVKKCATPIIAFEDGKLKFSCETEGVEFVSEVTAADAKKNFNSEVSLTGIYKVTVYATKAGYDNSDVATMEFTLGAGGNPCDVNNDGAVDVADIATIISRMAEKK